VDDNPARAEEPNPRHGELERTIERLDRWGSDRGWRGSDPYDGLGARRLGVVRRSVWGRRALTQIVKRAPIDLRPALGIAPADCAAALAQVLSARVRRSGGDGAGGIGPILARLAALRSGGYDEPCWGYQFDVQTRFFYYPGGSPNTIATAFVGLALLDAAAATGDRAPLELAEGAGEFFLRRVPQTAGAGGAYFGYLPGDRTPIHNASLLAASLLAALADRTGRRDFRDASAAAVGYAVAHQRADGSWPYAEGPIGRWVDGFHTGYVLDSLLRCVGPVGGQALRTAYERGLSFYSERLFLDDGTPKYLEDSLYPIDSQCVAQGIRTFSLASVLGGAWLERAWRVYDFATSRMRRPDGAFIFQRRRLWANRAPHVRWVQAPMLEALAQLWAASGGERR
jgi:hypothetical protein